LLLFSLSLGSMVRSMSKGDGFWSQPAIARLMRIA
jgi:hypothetical protein